MSDKDGASPEVTRGVPRLRAWMAREPVQAVTLIGLLVYSSFRLDYFMFYSLFEINPEEVGHGYVSTLAQSVVGSALIFLYIFVVLVPAQILVVLISGPTREMFRRAPKTAIVALPAAAVTGYALGWLFGHRLPFVAHDVDRPLLAVSSAILCWMLIALSYESIASEWVPRRVGSAVWRWLPGSFLGVGSIVLFVALPWMARLDAEAAMEGYARPAQLAGVLSLPWATDVAFAHWIEGSPPPGLSGAGDCFVYLGRSDGVIVLWSPVREEVLRIPEGRVALISTDAYSCAEASVRSDS